ncbi:hypothetical protein LEP1GSC072_1610 [Leptospira noguchii str. Bonito]|nr:hypothetical protein LEP1GSC072_1610 [Leptospira noguchii str. Bonito]
MERKELNETLFTKALETKAQRSLRVAAGITQRLASRVARQVAFETQHNALYESRCGLKNTHFSSVPTRMSLFTCKKYVFLIEKSLPNFST